MSWFQRLFHRRSLYSDLAEEMRAHIEEKTEQFMREGMTREEAEHAARRAFGNATLVEERSREVWQWPRIESLWADAKFALRQLAKSPAFTATAILTLALGIGANTAVFSVMNAVLLRFLAVSNPQQLVYLHYDNEPSGASQSGYGDTSLSMPIYEQLRTQHQVFSDLMAFAPLSAEKVAIRIGEEPEEALGEMVTGNFFSTLGVKPYLGRGFTGDDETNHAPVAVLNYSWWTRRFARNPSILGQTLYVNGVPLTIIGVAQPDFQGADPERAMDFWIPLQNRPELTPWGNSPLEHTLYGSPQWYCLLIMGRLQPGVSWQQALAAIRPIYQRAAYAGVNPDPKEPKAGLYFSSARGIEDFRTDYQQPLHFLMGMVVLVLVIACSNVAMLLMARNSTRQREFGVRMALGASRLTLFRQLLTESLLLVGLGAALGLVFAIFATRALTLWADLQFPVSLDRTVLLFTLAVAAFAALVFGLAPLRSAIGIPVASAMKTSGATANTDRNRFLGRRLLVTLQMSLCLVLLVAAGLLFRSLRNLKVSDLGMRADGLLVFGLEPQHGVRTDDQMIRFHTAVLDRLRTLPGAAGATMMVNRLGSGWSSNTLITVDGQNPLPSQKFAPVRWNAVGPDFLHVLGIPLVLGRDITDADTSTAQKVIIVNQTFVEEYLPHTSPLGHQVSLHGEESASGQPYQFTIVGVARNSRYRRIREKPWPIAYVPFTQTTGNTQMQFAVRTHGDPIALLPDIRRVIRDIDPNLPLEKPMTQRAQFEESISTERLLANLSLFFGVLAALLVAVGLYGTLSYRISRRVTEIGVRMALGANRQQILFMIVRESLVLAVAGLALGLPLAILLARVLRSLLYGLSPTDPMTFTFALFGISVVTLAASAIPARRASAIDPMQALRSE